MPAPGATVEQTSSTKPSTVVSEASVCDVPSTVVPVPDVSTVALAEVATPLSAGVPTASLSASSGPTGGG